MKKLPEVWEDKNKGGFLMDKYPLLVITGPTAVGKTKLSLKIAERFNGEIISADSMQIYRYMDIGTAKLSLHERKNIRHYMLDIINPDEEFSVAEYQKRVNKLIPELIKRKSLPILVGGTGLYIKAVVEGFLFPEINRETGLRNKLEEEAAKFGNEHLHFKLKEVDPELAEKLHPNDLRRVIRGLEIYKETGHTQSYYQKKQEERPSRYNTLKIGLIRDREELYSRINKRVDLMLKSGLVEEIIELVNRGYNLSITSFQCLGYKEIIGFLKNEYSLEEATRILKRNTRRFAKRQISWFKREKDINWFNLSRKSQDRIYEEIIELISNWQSSFQK